MKYGLQRVNCYKTCAIKLLQLSTKQLRCELITSDYLLLKLSNIDIIEHIMSRNGPTTPILQRSGPEVLVKE
ncbi:unnamed protein product [Hermetia illucens]|uniref:Uncharacterized protein n=1 Tax=Hermetia illucens TaxID=343691 RepID=A0A7R8UCZ2_HERIL|nr:unnamed protein product [Hermetia illucens]